MTLDQQKEQFSRAWVHAVAAAAGYRIYGAHPDIDSDDIGFSDTRLRMRPRLEAQLKCSQNVGSDGDQIAFPLPIKNYCELIGDDFQVPRILILLRVPPALDNWLEPRPEEMILKHTAWWMSLRTLPPSDNLTSVTVHIPRSQVFTPTELARLMTDISQGKKP